MADLTKYGGSTNIRIPPESTGSRIGHYSYWYFKVTSLSAMFDFPAQFSCSISSMYGVVHSVEAFEDGLRLLVLLDNASPRSGLVINETITITDNTSIVTATIKSWDEILLNSTAITDALRPSNSLTIDNVGAASVRFNEGQPQFDAFGLLRTSSISRLADYSFRYDELPTLFQKLSSGASSALTFLPNESSFAIDIGTGAGDFLSYTSNNFHPYTPGIGQLTIMTVAVGDSGKNNVIRRWGYFEEKNGVFFELDGMTLNVVIRTYTSGTVVETRIPQTQWNGDKINGAGGNSNLSRMLLDLTKLNLYWIDLAWLGAGRIRFGVYSPQGERIVSHSLENANALTVPYIGTADLPVRVEQVNSGVSASPSRLKVTCISVLSEGEVDDDYLRIHSRYTSWSAASSVSVTDAANTMVVAVRAGELFKGKANKRKIIPQKLNYYIEGSPVELKMQLGIDAMISGGAWLQCHPQASAEYNVSGTLLMQGDLLSSVFLPVGATSLDASPDFNSKNSFMSRLANGSPGTLVIFTARGLVPGQTSTVRISVDWTEL